MEDKKKREPEQPLSEERDERKEIKGAGESPASPEPGTEVRHEEERSEKTSTEPEQAHPDKPADFPLSSRWDFGSSEKDGPLSKNENANSSDVDVPASADHHPEPVQVEVQKPANPRPESAKEDTGIFSAIKREVHSTPKPKKILIATLVASMTVAGLFGFGAYAFDSSKVKADVPAAVKEQPKPAKLQLYLDDKKFELDLLSIGYDGKDLSTINQEKLAKWLDSVRDQVKIEPKNARFKHNKWGNSIIRGEEGRVMDVKTVKTWLKDLRPYINKPTQIPTISVAPKVSSADLREVNKKMIGSYTTKFDPGNVNRTTNIKLASAQINNLVLLPGERFSFNKVVGERTAARGYKPAHVIVKGEFTEGIGGGICQVSSTLYNSVDEAGLKVTAIQHHSAEVTYVPKGRDATVSWGGPDFRFKNNLNKPVLLKIKISGSHLTVNVYTSPGAKVQSRKVEKAPESFSTITVDPTKPNAQLPKTTTSQ
ncbi:VanW family protein [Thermoactinomyces daqus]|uniref:VanW family protein n=1 Tax=Thermoactinomyces daqus TaxID=1329516 RepID=A0A7W1XB88_9BACL|nr:VanW family protein [Thermoactinomyces daqus]MBA4543368.1 VanW family protein [Thermoactinomyces daqus]MBH8605266.1 VanW family protein [Thermoactinomyces sp. CICC 10522]